MTDSLLQHRHWTVRRKWPRCAPFALDSLAYTDGHTLALHEGGPAAVVIAWLLIGTLLLMVRVLPRSAPRNFS